MTTRDDVEADRIVILGQSLGGAVGIVMAERWHGVRGLAVEGAFSSYRAEAMHVCRKNLFMRRLALPRSVKHESPATLRE